MITPIVFFFFFFFFFFLPQWSIFITPSFRLIEMLLQIFTKKFGHTIVREEFMHDGTLEKNSLSCKNHDHLSGEA